MLKSYFFLYLHFFIYKVNTTPIKVQNQTTNKNVTTFADIER